MKIGIRAHDSAHTVLLAFLYLTSTPDQNAASCLQADLTQIRKDSARSAPREELNPEGTDTHATSTLLLTYPSGIQHLYRYAGSGDQCVAIQLYPDAGTKLDLPTARATLALQGYDPTYSPSLTDQYTYAGMLYRSRQYKASAAAYRSFLAALPRNKETLRARRVATDNMAMSLSISGDVTEARRILTEAIKKDPTYPLYYYNLACADAEQGEAPAARTHLQQAWDRRANMLQTEVFPDPTTEPSLLKLKSDPIFWTYAQSLKQ